MKPDQRAIGRTLRELFWVLLVRGRATPYQNEQRKGPGFGLQCAGFVCIGILPAVGALQLSAPIFTAYLHVFTMMFAALTLATSAGSMLFAREETEILLHRPVPVAQLLRAKAWVMTKYAWILAMCLNSVSLLVALFAKSCRDSLGLLWLPAHVLSTTLLMVFCTATIVLAYNLCLRWFGRERLDNLLAIVQTVMTLVMIVGSQIAPRFMMSEDMRAVESLDGILVLFPPVWFGALDVALCGAAPLEEVWVPALLALVSTGALVWFAFDLLADSYGKGLASIGAGADKKRESGRGRTLSRLVTRGPFRKWLASPVQRHAFILASAYLARDRETKMKIYPGLIPLIAMPLIIFVGPSQRGGSNLIFVSWAIGYVAMVPLQPMVQLQCSEHYRTAALYQYAPLEHWSLVFHGFRKAVVAWLGLPAWGVVTGGLCLFSGSVGPLLIGLPMLFALPLFSLVPGLSGSWLPLSRPTNEMKDASLGCLTMAVVVFIGMALSICASLVYTELSAAWFCGYLAICAGASIYIFRAMSESIRERVWINSTDSSPITRRIARARM